MHALLPPPASVSPGAFLREGFLPLRATTSQVRYVTVPLNEEFRGSWEECRACFHHHIVGFDKRDSFMRGNVYKREISVRSDSFLRQNVQRSAELS
jgi:hypothetical protein